MIDARFHYAFALADRKEKLQAALAKIPRNNKEVSYLRQSVYQLKIANNEKITVHTSSTTTSVAHRGKVDWRIFGEQIEFVHI